MIKQVNIPNYNLGNYQVPETCLKDTCVDIGANIGDFVTSQVSKFKLIHFYEPYSPCFNIVKEKISKYNNVVGWEEAVYKTDNEKVSLVAHCNYDAGSNAIKTDLLNNDWKEEIQNQIITVSLPTILKRIGGHINYLKVDCETSEYYLFMNQDLSNIDYIGIEIHSQMGKQRYDELLTYINKTHITTDDFSWEKEKNKECNFINKRLI